MSPRLQPHTANDTRFESFPPRHAPPHLSLVAPPAPQIDDAHIEFVIAAHPTDFEAADALVRRCYGWRGYALSPRNAQHGETTLLARRDGETIGTLTMRCGTRLRLQAECGYAEHVHGLRRPGRRLIECTRFAIDRTRQVPDDLALQLMHRALLLAHVALSATDCVIEVNPRHARYYRREFGFLECGPERTCERVGAPARLLHLDLTVPSACITHDLRPRPQLH